MTVPYQYLHPQDFGIVVGVYPSTVLPAGLVLEVATGAAAASSKWVTVMRWGHADSPQIRFTHYLPNDGLTRYYRFYHTRPGYTDSSKTAVIAGVPKPLTHLPEPLRLSSTPLNSAASVLPIPMTDALFSYSAGGLANFQMWIAWTWSAFTLYRPDGSTIVVSSPPASAGAPTLAQVAGGVRGATTLYGRTALLKNSNLAAVSAETSFAVSANNLLTVTSPAAVRGYDTWLPLVGSATNSEYAQTATAFGTDWTEPVGHFDTTTMQYSATWLTRLVASFAGLLASTTYYFYPYYDLTYGLIVFPIASTTKNVVSVAEQNADGHIGLTPFVNLSAATPAGAGSSSGSGGGGKYL